MTSIDSTLLTSYYSAKFALASAQTASNGNQTSGATTTAAKAALAKIPTPPWDTSSAAAHTDKFYKQTILGANFINLGGATLDAIGASLDYQKLFALYQGLDALSSITDQAAKKNVTTGELGRLQTAFARGMSEISDFTDTLKTDQFRLASGAVSDSLKAAAGVPLDSAQYITGPILTGSSSDEVPAFQGDVQFNMAIKRLSTTTNVAIDLSEMGAQPRTLANVLGFINGKLSDVGAFTRVASARLPNEPRTVKVGDKTITLPAVADSWALKIAGDTTESVTFSAPATAGAVYVAQSTGNALTVSQKTAGKVDTTTRQILKFQTDSTSVDLPSVDGQPIANGRVFADDLGKEVATARATATGSDGSLYVLTDVTGTTNDQTIQGSQDVALKKYDSAGKLIYTRTLGAATNASGYALAVSADGQVAIAGSVTGVIQGVTNGPTNSSATSGVSDSFVTLFNAAGEETWTMRRGAVAEDQATAVAFGADGEVFVAGRTKGPIAGGVEVGGWDNYLTAYGTSSTGAPTTLFTQQYGTTGDDKVAGIAVNGDQVVVAGTENGDAVARSFQVSATAVTTTRTIFSGVLTIQTDTKTNGVPTGSTSATYATAAPDSVTVNSSISSATLTAGTVRDLGNLNGGSLAGVGFDGAGNIVVAGTTSTDQLNAGSATNGFSGGRDAFVAKLAGDLNASGADRLSFYGGDGEDSVSAMTVAGGHVWIAGTTESTTLNGAAMAGARDGFAAEIDADTGAVGWSARYTGLDGNVAPTSIAVDTTGSSVLDRLGLPKATLQFKSSPLLTASTSLRAGDEFYIRAREGDLPTAITIAANDTLATLATKVRRAVGFGAKVETVHSGFYSVLKISPLNKRSTVEIIAGKGGKDALEALGLTEGVARTLGGDADKDKKIYGLRLSHDLNLGSAADIKTATDQLTTALSQIRTIYRDLKAAASPPAGKSAANGPVPAYLQAQLANYTAGLNRLTGGG